MVKITDALAANQKVSGCNYLTLNQAKTGDKLSLNYKQITTLYDSVPQPSFRQIKKLFLSHNLLQTLQGIQNFPFLTHLSVSYNQLQTVDELLKISDPSKLECLALAGNYFIEHHPDYKQKIIEHFVSLKELDGQQIGKMQRQQLRDSKQLKAVLIPFVLKLEQLIERLHQSKQDKECSELIEMVDNCKLKKQATVTNIL